MKAIFIDCNQELAAIFKQVHRPDDPPISINTAPFDGEELPRVLGCHAICLDDHSYMPTERIARCPSLKHIVFLGTGAASYMDIAALGRLGVTVHTIKGYGDTAVAEHAIALMWAAAREVARMDRAVRAGIWQPLEGMQLTGKILGIIGLGGIGREVARLARGLGMQVLAWNRTPRPDAGFPLIDLDTLLASADIVSLHLVLNDETRGFLCPARLRRIKPGAILINTARGALVDEGALAQALESGAIRHAGLDVFHAEPLESTHPLAKLDNVTLTAHAGFRTPEASMTLMRRAIDIVRDIGP